MAQPIEIRHGDSDLNPAPVDEYIHSIDTLQTPIRTTSDLVIKLQLSTDKACQPQNIRYL